MLLCTRLKGRFTALTLACRAQVRPLRGPYVARLPGVYEILCRLSASVKRKHYISMIIVKESEVFTLHSETRFAGHFARQPVGNKIIRRSPTNMK